MASLGSGHKKTTTKTGNTENADKVSPAGKSFMSSSPFICLVTYSMISMRDNGLILAREQKQYKSGPEPEPGT